MALGTLLFTDTFKELFESLFGAQDIVQLVECLIHLQEYMAMFSSTEKKTYMILITVILAFEKWRH